MDDFYDQFDRAVGDEGAFPFVEAISEKERKKYSERLLTLAALIESITPRQYKHDSWIKKNKPEEHCGTVACALGHATLNKKALFPTLPFKVVQERDFWSDKLVWDIHPMGDGFDYDQRADDYFGPGAMEAIFSGGAYPVSSHRVTQKQAVKRIRRFVKESFGYEPA